MRPLRIVGSAAAVCGLFTLNGCSGLQQHSRGEAEKPTDQCHHRLRYQEIRHENGLRGVTITPLRSPAPEFSQHA